MLFFLSLSQEVSVVNKNLCVENNNSRYLYDMRILFLACFTLFLLAGHHKLCAQVVHAIEIVETKEIEARIFPNPADDYFKIEIAKQVKRVTVSDIFGKLIYSFKAQNDHRYNIGDLRKGMYVVRIIGPEENLLKVLRLSKS